MGILHKLKSALGLKSETDGRRGPAGNGEPAAENEAAVKGTDEPVAAGSTAAGSTGSITEEPPEAPGDDDVAEAAEPAEAAGPQSQVSEPAPSEDDLDSDGDSDSAESADENRTGDESPEAKQTEGESTADERTGSAELTEEPPGEGAAEAAEAAGPGDDAGQTESEDGAGESVSTVSGIGPAYADRLADAGVETVGDLLAVDAGSIAEKTSLSQTRIERWQDRARER